VRYADIIIQDADHAQGWNRKWAYVIEQTSKAAVLTTWIIRSENWLSLDNYGEYFWVCESTTVFFEEKNFKKKLEASPQLYFARKSFFTRKKTVLSPQLYS